MKPPDAILELGDLGFDRGAHLLVKRALSPLSKGQRLEVRGRAPGLATHLRAWCRAQGHELDEATCLSICRGDADRDRWRFAMRAEGRTPGSVAEAPESEWGLAARGALIEAGGPEFHFPMNQKRDLWADEAADLYRQAVAAQWNPDTAIEWNAPRTHPPEIESALVQVLTYLIENETAALLVPARFASKTHPHFREVLQLLAIQAADEARHIEVFTRRATLDGRALGVSSAGGRASLKTLVDEPDFEMASFLLSVLGEGSFLNLLSFLRCHAPDACTEQIMHLAAVDEARHVAFGMAHLLHRAADDDSLRGRLALAIEARHDTLRATAGLNEEVFDGLVLLAAGGWDPERIAEGHEAVIQLTNEMDHGRRSRLRKLGFDAESARRLSSLHTRNFM